jgi:hypothetical protein
MSILRDTTSSDRLALSYTLACKMFVHNMFNTNYTVLSYGMIVLKSIMLMTAIWKS